MSSDIKEKVRKIKISRLNKNDHYFLNLIENMKLYKPFFWSKDFYQSKGGKTLFEVNNVNKTLSVNQSIVDYYDEQHILQPQDYVCKMIYKYVGFIDYTITFFK